MAASICTNSLLPGGLLLCKVSEAISSTLKYKHTHTAKDISALSSVHG